MIRNRLSLLMTERGLSASRVGNDTGIAKSTLSKITNNNSSKIDYSTINTLCNYLKITPADFFEYSPLDASFYFELGNLTTTDEQRSHGEPLEFTTNGFINFTKYGDKFGSIEFNGSLMDYGIVEHANNNDIFLLGIFLNPISDTSKYFDDLSISLQAQIKSDFSKFIEKKLNKEWKQDSDNKIRYEIAISFDADKPASFKPIAD